MISGHSLCFTERSFMKFRYAAVLLTVLCLSACGAAGGIDNTGNTDNSVNSEKAANTENSDNTEIADNSEKTENIENIENTENSENNENSGSTSNTDDSASDSGNPTSGSSLIDTEDIFSINDMGQYVDVSELDSIVVKDGETIEITEEGMYAITGEAKNCTIKVAASDEDKIRLVLHSLKIENDDFPAIYVVSVDKCFVMSADWDNSLSVTGTFRADGNVNTDAVIFSKQDLTLCGEGSLDITSAEGNGVSVKDDLRITGGTYSISSKKDAVEANDSIAIVSSIFNIDSQKDGFNCGDDDNVEPGWIYIETGILNIAASNDGIQADGALRIDGGEFDINSGKKGLKAAAFQIYGGSGSVNGEDIKDLDFEESSGVSGKGADGMGIGF